jgi:hypothetical protein
MIKKILEWFNPPVKTAPPDAALVGLPVEINPTSGSKVTLIRHAGRLVTLYGAEQTGAIAQEIERRCAELRSTINFVPKNAAQAEALLNMLRS